MNSNLFWFIHKNTWCERWRGKRKNLTNIAWAHVHIISRGKRKSEKALRTNCCFPAKAERFSSAFPGCLLLLYFDFPSLFSGINISIIEPSWFRCYHRDDPSIPSAPHSLWQLAVCRDVNKFLLNKSLVTIGIFLSIFLKIFFCCWQQQTASTKKKILFFGRVNICHASNFLVLQETPEIFNQNWSDKREERTRRGRFFSFCLQR